MSMIDFRQVDDGARLSADICIVGSGPAGIAIAAQFVGTGVRVLLLESGGLERDARYEALNAFESVGASRSAPELVRQRGFGGTSALWTGRCGVFDEIDYARRPWLAVSGWPVGPDAVRPHLDRAGQFLGLGPALYGPELSSLIRNALDHPGWDARALVPVVWQYSRGLGEAAEADGAATPSLAVLQHTGAPQSKHLGRSHRSVFERADNVDVLLHATATEIETNEAGHRVSAVVVRALDGRTARVTAARVVLACGGIDNARLMLASTSARGCGVGNERGAVGRFLTDHTFAELGTYRGKGSEALRARLGSRWLDRGGNRHVYQVGLRMAPELQRREGLLNCSVHALSRNETPHPIALLGEVLRGARNGSLGAREALKLAEAARSPMSLARGVHDRYVARRPSLGQPEEVAIGCMVEQELDPDSRITLSRERDAFGVPLAKIDWRISDLECRTAKRMSDLVFSEMTRLGYELPDPGPWRDAGPEALRPQLIDLAHPMCATRMSDDPATGVVDANCKVHGVENLFVAGGSVFGTPGHMNPTLMIVSLSLRLADHLKSEIGAANMPAWTASPASPRSAPRRARVGILGAGDRIRRVHLPALAALSDACEIVGVASRSRASAERLAGEAGSAAFATLDALVGEARPDFVISAVSSAGVDAVLAQLAGRPLPVLLETPFAWDVRHGRRMLQRIRKGGQAVGVAEQTPFLPEEQFKRKLIDLGLFGRILAAENDFSVYDYHGVAALRRLVNGGGRLVRVNAVRPSFPAGHGSDRAGGETWDLATLTFDDGTTLIHRYGAFYADSPLRGPRTTRLVGTAGSMHGDAVRALGADGRVFEASVRRHVDGGRLLALSLQAPGEEHVWENPFAAHPLDDEQIAVATLLANMVDVALNGGHPIYPADEALDDMDVMTAIRYSAEAEGAPMSLPLRAGAHLRRVPAALGRKASRRLGIGRHGSAA